MRISVLLLKFHLIAAFIIKSEGKTVTFKLPSKSSGSSEKSDKSTSEEDEGSDFSSSDSSSAELLFDKKGPKGQFRHLKKDDDLLALKGKRSKKSESKKRTTKPQISAIAGGKQAVGFVYHAGWDEGISELNGFSESIEKMTSGIVKEPINSGWWLFAFSSKSSDDAVSSTKFNFQTNLPVKVSLVDLFCRGDSFGVLDGGKLVAQSSRIRAEPECAERMVSPVEALNDGRWSSVVFELEPGEHFIEIKPIDNLAIGMRKGIAAIKFDHILPADSKGRRISRNKVCRGYNGLTVITEDVLSSQSEIICLQLKMQIARVNENDLIVKKSLKSCGKTAAWLVDKVDGKVKAVSSDGKLLDAKNYGKLPIICRVN